MGYIFYINHSSLFSLARESFHGEILMPVSHLPTVMLIIGYLVYWAEMFYLSQGSSHTTWLAPALFLIFSLILIYQRKNQIRNLLFSHGELKQISWLSKGILALGSLLTFVIFLIVFKASLLPPHLTQEFDALNYHIAVPKQHLMLGSFAHIPWSLADLYFLPVDYGLAPYWLFTPLPNKFPQFIFLLGLLGVVVGILSELGRGDLKSGMLIIFAVVGTHCFAIQMGLAMLDIVLCYLFIAAIDSFLKGKKILCAVELTFYFWSKSFAPIQIVFIGALLMAAVFLLNKSGFRKVGWICGRGIEIGDGKKYLSDLKKVFMIFCVASMFVGGPFVGKSLLYADTPLFPFYPGIISFSKKIDYNSKSWESLREKAGQAVATKDQYGAGRGPAEFFKHLWLLAVPERGVNNRYDYPVGLVYLLCLVPFVSVLINSLRDREILFLPLLVILFWLTWWLGSHQSRFLFIPLVLMYISVISQKKFQTVFLQLGILLSLSLVTLSVYRAHRGDLRKSPYEVLREQDRQLLEMAKGNTGEPVVLDFFDVAFANFPVNVHGSDSVFVIGQ